jgi:2,4-dienoyl-CoA reductase-like NADH-dependent reductase (Old Yellow Enzyme family)
VRLTQVKNLKDLHAFKAHVDALAIDVPVDDVVAPDGVLGEPVSFTDGTAGTLQSPNRFAILPMEGWDGSPEGRPTDLVRRRWERFGRSGCGLVWAEATAVRADGRANPSQLLLDDTTLDDFAALRALLDPSQVAGLQLTHSGRYACAQPRIAYRHPILDARVGADDANLLSDDELDELVACYVDAAVRARAAGFDFVDIKHCHGYLLHELLSARDRPGRFGGDFEGRTRFLCSVVKGIRARAPDLAIAVRLSAFDFVPFTAGDDGRGTPEWQGAYPHTFGGDGSGTGIDLREPHLLLDLLASMGVRLVSTTAGSPYYVPHVQRPAYFPPSDGYQPPEDPLVGVARQLAATAELAHAHPQLTIVGSGYSYLQQWLPHVAQAAVSAGNVAMIGLGRMALSYPGLAADVLAGRPLNTRDICRTFSDCTTAPRHGLVSGCYPLDPFYKERPERRVLAQVKKQAKC